MVTIKVNSKKLKDVWDIQRATYILKMCGLSSDGIKGLSQEEKTEFKKQITLYLWKKIKEQFPQIESFCKDRTGGFNKIKDKNYKTPIICIHGSFYMQLISENNKNAWCWESVDLTPYRFEFNEEGYFKKLVIDAINKALIQGDPRARFEKLVNALNKNPHKEKVLTIQTRGKNIGKVDLHEAETRII